MNRADILLDTKSVKELIESSDIINKEFCLNHISEMEKILDRFWLMMLKIKEHENFKPLGELMRIYFNENV